MGNVRHSQQEVSDGIHGFIAYEYATEAARLAATGFTANDLWKVAVEVDSKSMYVLVGHSPIAWEAVGNDAITPHLNKVEKTIVKASAGTISVGQVVHVVSWDTVNDRARVELAKADSASTMPCAGVCNVQATDSTPGKIMLLGTMLDLDTSGLVGGAPTYISHVTAGMLTTTPPPGPYVVQSLGVCLNSDASEGVLGINILSYRAYDYANPASALGTAAAGTRNVASPSDHVHPLPKLDDLASPDDNTDLNASVSAHGLLSKLPDDAGKFLDGTGAWVARPSSSVVLNVRNESGAAMSKGDAVYVSGWSATHGCSLVGLADKNDAAKRPALGLLQDSLADNGNGYALVSGKLTGMNTSTPGWAVTDQLVLGANGALSRPPPDQDPFVGEVQNIGVVTRVDGVDGEILVVVDGMIPVPSTQLFVLNSSELAKTADPTVNDDANDGYKVGSRWINTTDDHEFVCVANTVGAAVWSRTTCVNIFGNGHKEGSSDGESSTTSGDYQQKLRITTDSLPVGTYRVGWYCELNKNSLTDFAARVQVNDTTTIAEVFEEAKDAGSDQWNARGGFGYYAGSGVLNIDLDYHANNSGTTKIRRGRLEIWRVA